MRRRRPRTSRGKGTPRWPYAKKGNTWHFGMKAHVGSDPKGRVHSVVATPASVHDAKVMEACLHGQEKAIYGDKAYADQVRKQRAEEDGVVWRVHRKANRGRRLNCADRSFNRKSNRVAGQRSNIPLASSKHLWGYRKVRYRGLAKNTAFSSPCSPWPTSIWSEGNWLSHREQSVQYGRTRADRPVRDPS